MICHCSFAVHSACRVLLQPARCCHCRGPKRDHKQHGRLHCQRGKKRQWSKKAGRGERVGEGEISWHALSFIPSWLLFYRLLLLSICFRSARPHSNASAGVALTCAISAQPLPISPGRLPSTATTASRILAPRRSTIGMAVTLGVCVCVHVCVHACLCMCACVCVRVHVFVCVHVLQLSCMCERHAA